MFKNFLFGALLLNMIAVYLSYKQIGKSNNKMPLLFAILGSAAFVIMIILTIDLTYNTNPILFNFPLLLWGLLIGSILIEVFSLYKKIIPGQLIAASIFLFLVYPTILSIGFYLLIITIIELAIALFYFQKQKHIGF